MPTPAPPDPEQLKRSAGVRLELASLYFSRGQFNTALDEIKLAIQADPKNGAAYNLSGLIYAALGNMAQADASFQRALQINPRDADTMNNYGWVLCQNQRYKEADVQFQQALVQPNYRGAARTMRVMGICQARDNRLDDAEASLMRSYQIDPSSAETAVQPGRGAVPPRRVRTRALLHRPRQQVARTVQRADPVAGRAHRIQAGQPDAGAQPG